MDLHKLLQKQINKHLTVDCIENPSFKAFFQAVNDSYLAFERDKGIMDHTFKESEKEYHEINDQLKKEIELKKLAANNLYKSINKDDLDYNIPFDHNDDLLFVSEYLKAQIDKTRDAEKALLENLKELGDYKYALDQTAFIDLTDEKGIIKSVNDKFCEISQFSREEFIGNTHAIINSKFHPKSFFKELYKTISSGNIWQGLIKNKKKNGDYYWFDTTIVPFLDADKKPVQYLAIRLDVTEIKNAEININNAKKRVEQSEEHNRLIMDSSLNSIVSTDHNNKITFWNKQAEVVFGWKKEEVVGKPMIDLLIPSRYRTKWNGIIDQYLKDGENHYFDKRLELNLLHKSGNEFYAETSITPIIVGESTYFSAFIQDISKRKEAEKQLHQNSELLKTVLSNLRSGIRMEDQNRKLLFANQHYYDMRNINSEPEELATRDGSSAPNELPLFFKDAERLSVKTKKTLRDRKLVMGELLETLDNHFIERDYIPLFVDNEYKGHLWKYTDVTEKAQILKLLKQSEEHNLLIMNSSLNSIVTIDSAKKITFWNQQAETVFGWKKEEVLGKNMIDLLIPSRYRDMWNGVIDQYPKNGVNPYSNQLLELTLLHKAGNEFYGETSITPIVQNGIRYYSAFIQDVTKRKEAEKQLHNNVSFLNSLLSNINAGVVAFNDANEILFLNQSFCTMRNITSPPSEFIGNKLWEFAKSQFLNTEEATKGLPQMIEMVKAKKMVKDVIIRGPKGTILERDYIPITVSPIETIHLITTNDVTQRIRDQKLLEESEERNLLIMNSSLNSIVTADSAKKITFWNHQSEIVFGWKEEEVLGKVFTDFMVPARNKELWDNSINQYLSEGHNEFLNKQVELYGVNKAGDEFLAEITITPMTHNGETFFCAFLQDISKRREAENKLSETTELLKAFLYNIQSGICVVDDNNKIVFVNQDLCDMRGVKFTPEELTGQDLIVLLHESKLIFKDQESHAKRVHEIENGRQIVLGELLETIDNRFIERDYIPLFLNNNNRAHLWKSTDVTQRIRNQRLLEQSEMRSNLIMNASLNAIITIDIKGVITFWNHQAETIFGWNKDEVLGKELSKIIIPHQYVDAHNTGMQHYLKTGEGPVLNKPIEITALNRMGIEFPIELSIIPIDEDSQVFFCAFIQDISEKKTAENIRKIQEEKFQNVITHMNLGLIEVDNNEIIQYANQSFASITGYEISELVGKNPIDIFAFGDNFNTLESKNELRQHGVSDIYQIPIKNKTGELRWLAISGAPNYDNKGNVIGSIGIHLDITDQKQLEIDLEKEKTKALESSKAKEVFLANMSHEIRTPLNAIIGFLRELDKQELTGLQKDYVNNSSVASKHLLAIINDILDISKIEAGEMTLESEDFVFEKSISNVTTVLQPMLQQKGLDFNVTLSKEIERVLVGDALRLQQILYNLVGNAIKFTSKGSISINCEVVEDSTFSQTLQISISDTGIGMESSFVSTIFNKFSQEDKEITRKYGGTGLGLAITKELVELMGGAIEIQSEKNIGTTIRLRINFPKSSKVNTADLDIVKPVIRLDNISILLVEDNYLNRMVAQNSLNYYNCEVIEAENGLEAVEILKNKTFDIILMDIQMPIMGGIEASLIIRNELNILTPIIALTANAFKTEIDKCKKAGINDYVTKPFDEDLLIETIAKYTMNKIPSVAEPGLPETASIVKLYNLTALQNLSRGNNEFVAKMIAIFVEQTTDVIKKITAAILKDDFMEVSRLIHKIKPSVESLGISSIITEIKLLEKVSTKTSDKESVSTLFNIIKEVLEKAVIQLITYEIND